MTISVTAKLQVLSGKNQEFKTIFKHLVSAVLANEQDRLFYALNQPRENTQTYIVLEQYVDEAALQAHSKTDHSLNLGKTMAACLDAKPQIELMNSI
jgi:quinol monooxygenase YgiN